MLYILFNNFGKYGPVILNFISFFLLWNKENLFFYYTIGIFVNSLVNLILKGLFKAPRPSEDIKLFNLAVKNDKYFTYKNGIPYDIFGMPSGHAQSSLYSTVFIYLSIKNINILLLYSLISFITCIQRVYYKHHSILQIIVGAIVGAIFGYFIYYLSQKNLQGTIKEKPDDYAGI